MVNDLTAGELSAVQLTTLTLDQLAVADAPTLGQLFEECGLKAMSKILIQSALKKWHNQQRPTAADPSVASTKRVATSTTASGSNSDSNSNSDSDSDSESAISEPAAQSVSCTPAAAVAATIAPTSPSSSADSSDSDSASSAAPTDEPALDTQPRKKKAKKGKGRCTVHDLVVGKVYPGKVVGVGKHGAFIDIGCHKDGFCHVSRLKDDFCKNTADAVKQGDTVQARVLNVEQVLGKDDSKEYKVTLSLQSEAMRDAETRSIRRYSMKKTGGTKPPIQRDSRSPEEKALTAQRKKDKQLRRNLRRLSKKNAGRSTTALLASVLSHDKPDTAPPAKRSKLD